MSICLLLLLVEFLLLACLVCLLQGEDERLKSGEVSDQLEDPENPHHTHLHSKVIGAHSGKLPVG